MPARLFYALWPDAGVRARLSQLAQSMHADCGGRRVASDHLHITLVFIGNVARERIAQLEALTAACRTSTFALCLDATGYWRHNRIVWAAPRVVPESLRQLVAELEQVLDGGKFAFDRRPYAAHATLIRDAREPRRLPVPELTWQVAEFALVESSRDSRGLRYEALARWPLVPAPN